MDNLEQNGSKKELIKMAIYSLIPLVVFYFVDEYFGLVWGVVAAMISGVLEAGYGFFKTGKVDKLTLFITSLVVITGLISIFTNSGIAFKLQPALIEGLFTIILLGSVFTKKSFMVMIFEQKMGKISNPLYATYLNGISVRFGLFFLLHTFLTVYSAIYMSKEWWIFIKGILFNAMLAILFFLEFLYGKFVLKKKFQEQLKKQEEQSFDQQYAKLNKEMTRPHQETSK